jgi:hypothetical protein
MFVGLGFLLSAAASGTEPSRPSWVSVTKEPAAVRESTTWAFGTLGVVRNKPFKLAYYSKRTIQRRDQLPRVQWADSISCPALTTALGRLRELSPPRIDVPGFPPTEGGDAANVVIDGVSYTLKLDRLSFSTNVGSELAGWTETTLHALEPCWRAEAPSDVLEVCQTSLLRSGSGPVAAKPVCA